MNVGHHTYGERSPLNTWIRNLSRVFYHSDLITDKGQQLMEVLGLIYAFDADLATHEDEQMLREHDLAPIRGGAGELSDRLNYEQLLHHPRAGLSLEGVIHKLRQEPETKSATIQLPIDSTTKPCLCTVDFKVRHAQLETMSFFRSQDVWRRQPANIMFLLDCSRLVASAVGVTPGTARVFVASAHVYVVDAPAARQYLKQRISDVSQVPDGRPVAIAVVGREHEHGDLPAKPWAHDEAYAVGFGLASSGFVVITGGLGGIMESVCRGAQHAGGTSVGLVPAIGPAEAGKRKPNLYQSVIIRTGVDQRARIPMIVDSCDGMIVVNGGAGARIEAELALEQNKPVVAIATSGGVAEELLRTLRSRVKIS